MKTFAAITMALFVLAALFSGCAPDQQEMGPLPAETVPFEPTGSPELMLDPGRQGADGVLDDIDDVHNQGINNGRGVSGW